MSKFHPLRIEIEIITPIVHGNYYPIHLDGLIYWAIRNFSDSHDFAIGEMDHVFSKSSGIYHASQALFIKSFNSRIIATEVTRTTNFNWAEYEGTFTKVKKSIKENEGIFRKIFTERLAIKANRILFFAHGDAQKLSFYLNSLLGVGRSANAGFGEIAKVDISKSMEDNSWFLDDKLNRILPTSIFSLARNEPIKSCRYKPNYKDGASAECYVPVNNVIVL
jgi:CRISPR type IV-associated protein Csf3